MLYDDKGTTNVSTDDFQSSKITTISDNNYDDKNSDISVCLSDSSICLNKSDKKPKDLTITQIKYNIVKNTLDNFDIVKPNHINQKFETLKNRLQIMSDNHTKTTLLQSFKEKLEQNLI